jgi:hypothetical protein
MNSSPTYSAPSTFTSSYTPSKYGTNKIGGINLWIILPAILIFAIIGFVVYKTYLDKSNQMSSFSSQFDSFSKYFLGLFGTTAADATKTITTNAATGTKAGVDVAEVTVNKGVNKVEKATGDIVGANAQTSIKGSQQTDVYKDHDNNSKSNYESDQFNHQQSQYNQSQFKQNKYHENQYNKYNKNNKKNEDSFNADDSSSCIQSNKSSNKAGWCFIGQDQGFRSCIQVGENDQCMSGDIFPSQEICVNPKLRA